MGLSIECRMLRFGASLGTYVVHAYLFSQTFFPNYSPSRNRPFPFLRSSCQARAFPAARVCHTKTFALWTFSMSLCSAKPGDVLYLLASANRNLAT